MIQTIKLTGVQSCRLNAFNVGWQILLDIKVNYTNFMADEIEVMGQMCLDKQKVYIGKVGNVWKVAGYGLPHVEGFKAYYVVQGRYITVLHPAHEFRSGRPLTGKCSPQLRKSPKARYSVNSRIANSFRMEK